MAMRMIVVALVVASACEREEAKKIDTPQVTPKPLPTTPLPSQAPCAKSVESGPVVLGVAARVPMIVPGGVVWPEQRGSDHAVLWLLTDDADKPRAISEAELEKLVGRPDRHLRTRCGDSGCGPHGGNIDLVLIEGSKERVIAKGQAEIEAAELVGDAVVWATFGAYGGSGGVFRTTSDGQPKKLWDGAITNLIVDKTDVYASGSGGVAWIDLETDKTVVLDEGSKETRAIALGGDRVVWADAGDPYHGSKPSGRILSAPRHGGTVTTHATEQPWPEAIAADANKIYWGSRDRGGVWSARMSGGRVFELVPADGKCGGVMWLHRTARGIVFIRGDAMSFRFGGGGEIWFMPFSG